MSDLPPTPATMSAEQIAALLATVAERRTQVQALRDGLEVFDEQLAALETAMAPLLAWSKAWSGMENAWTRMWRPPGT